MTQNIREIIDKIIYQVRNRHDYDSAVQIMRENNISLEQLAKSTFRLGIYDIALLGDRLAGK
jgi:hypothetical protein